MVLDLVFHCPYRFPDKEAIDSSREELKSEISPKLSDRSLSSEDINESYLK